MRRTSPYLVPRLNVSVVVCLCFRFFYVCLKIIKPFLRLVIPLSPLEKKCFVLSPRNVNIKQLLDEVEHDIIIIIIIIIIILYL